MNIETYATRRRRTTRTCRGWRRSRTRGRTPGPCGFASGCRGRGRRRLAADAGAAGVGGPERLGGGTHASRGRCRGLTGLLRLRGLAQVRGKDAACGPLLRLCLRHGPFVLLGLTALPFLLCGFFLCRGLAQALAEAQRVALRYGGRMRLRLDSELADTIQDLLVGQTCLLGEFVDADLAQCNHSCGWITPLSAAHKPTVRTVPAGGVRVREVVGVSASRRRCPRLRVSCAARKGLRGADIVPWGPAAE